MLLEIIEVYEDMYIYIYIYIDIGLVIVLTSSSSVPPTRVAPHHFPGQVLKNCYTDGCNNPDDEVAG